MQTKHYNPHVHYTHDHIRPHVPPILVFLSVQTLVFTTVGVRAGNGFFSPTLPSAHSCHWDVGRIQWVRQQHLISFIFHSELSHELLTRCPLDIHSACHIFSLTMVTEPGSEFTSMKPMIFILQFPPSQPGFLQPTLPFLLPPPRHSTHPEHQ